MNKKNTPRKPWITKGLANSCVKKERLYKAYIANPNDCNREKYKTYRNKLTKTLRAAEKDYYIKKFDAATHDMKKTWQLLKRILTENKSENMPVRIETRPVSTVQGCCLQPNT